MSLKARVVWAMLILYVVWGTTYLAIRVGVENGLPPAVFSGLRLAPAGLIMLAIARSRGAVLRLPARDLGAVSLIGLLLLVGGQYSMMVAEQWVASGIAALVVAVAPLWIALAESFFPDMQRPGKMGWAGLAVGFSGLGILVGPRITGIGASPEEITGLVVVVAGTWLWTIGSIYSKRRRVKVDGIVASGYQMLAAGTATLIIGTARGEWSEIVWTPAGAGALAYLMIFGSCIAFTAFVFALAHLPASKVLTYAYVNPVIAVFAGWAAGRLGLVPAEPITRSVLAGMVIIVAGVALTTLAPTLPPRRAPQDVEAIELADTPLIEPEPSEA